MQESRMPNVGSIALIPQDFLLTDDGWEAASQLPKLVEIIVEGVSLSEPKPCIMTRLEDLTINRATPAQLVRRREGKGGWKNPWD